MRNPFAFGEEVSGDLFCNRKKEIKEILEHIQSGQNIILYSPRRYGKTSLIKEVLRRAEGKGVVGGYVDLYPVVKEENSVSAYASAISRAPKENVEKVLDVLKNIFKRIRPKIVIKSKGQPEFGVEFSKNTEVMIEDVAQAVEEYSEKYKKQMAIVFDEFQKIGLLESDRIEKKLRSII